MGICNDSSIKLKEECKGKYSTSSFNKMGIVIPIQADRVWELPFNNYDNVFISMLTFFEISTMEMWSKSMFYATDAKGVDIAREEDANMSITAMYISFIFVTSFFVLNLFISVIVDKFNEELKERQG